MAAHAERAAQKPDGDQMLADQAEGKEAGDDDGDVVAVQIVDGEYRRVENPPHDDVAGDRRGDDDHRNRADQRDPVHAAAHAAARA